jgi:uncharacterized damage-inducible protein DinB
MPPSKSSDEVLRYPIGRYKPPPQITAADRARWLNELDALPNTLREAVEELTSQQLDTPYRPGGWTVRQVVHHLPDSHMNSYARFRFALTEEAPRIKPYNEASWAELPDAKSAPIEMSLTLLDALHARWLILLRSLSEDQFSRTFVHPELGEIALDRALGLYAWHGRHHLAQILNLRKQMRW